MSKMDVMKKIKEARGGVNSYYDMDIEDMEKISNNSHDRFSLISEIILLSYFGIVYSRNESPEGKRQKEKSMIIFIL